MTSVLLQSPLGGDAGTLIMMGGIVVVFYFFMIRPQQKKQKDQKKFRDALKKGDEVMTIGGIYGKVYEVKDNKVTVEVDRSTKLTFDRTSISGAANAEKK